MKRALLLGGVLIALVGCDVETPRKQWEQDAIRITGGDPGRGKAVIERYGCASCHTIPGIQGDANVGPPLSRIGSRVYVAGVLVNTPDNLSRWIKDPPGVDPRTAMPKLGVSDDDLKDITCYLYTLR